MKKKSIIKMMVDLFMTILLPLLMIQALAGEELHEWILIGMILSAISGIVLSQYAFALLNINQGISFARAAHMICTHWMFVLTSFHLGMHMKIIKGYMERARGKKLETVLSRVFTTLFAVIGVYGLKVFIDTKLWQYMFYQARFMFYDFNRMAFGVYLDYVSMMVLFAVIGYFVSDRLKKIPMPKK